MENKNIPFKPNKEFKYSITYTITTDDSAEMGEYADSGFEVEPTESAIGEIIKMAHRNYGIYNPIAIGRWESTSPIEDKNYFEKGESRFFNLHITNIDGSDLDEEEHEFITYLLTEGEFDQSDYEDFGMGGSTNSGLSWHQDRARHNKSEDYEIPMSKRKFAKGGGVENVWIALSKTKNGLLLSERFDNQITHKQLFDYYKKSGHEIIDSNIFKVTNKDVLDVFKDAISKYIKEKYDEVVDWENTLLSYEIVGDRIIAQSCFVETKNGNEYKITPNDLVNNKFADGGGVNIGDEIYWKGNKYTLGKITEDRVAGMIDKKYHLWSYKVGIEDAILDSLKGVTKSKKMSDGGDISEEANLRNRISNLKRLYNMVNESEKADLKYTIDNLEAQQRNLHKMEKGGSTEYNHSWHFDHDRHNKSEDYEIPMSKRKFDDGGEVGIKISDLKEMFKKQGIEWEDDNDFHIKAYDRGYEFDVEEGLYYPPYEDDEYSKGGGVDEEEAVEQLWKGYASAILFAESDSDTEEPLDANYSISDFDEETIKSSKDLIRKFYLDNKKAIKDSGLDLDTIGNDIWYTRAGHGAGFFDHSLDKDIEDKLINGAKSLGEYPSVETYDGKISVRGGRVFADGGELKVGDEVEFSVPYFESKFDYKGKVIELRGSYAVVEYYEPLNDKTLRTHMDLSRLNKTKMSDGGGVDGHKHVLHIDGQNWFLEKIDSTHFYMSNDQNFRGVAHHIGQHKGEPYYEEVREWLKSTYAKGGGVEKTKDFQTYAWKTKQDVIKDNYEIYEDEEMTESEVIAYYKERMKRGYDYAVQIYTKGKNPKQIFRSESFDKTLDEYYEDIESEMAKGGGVGEKVFEAQEDGVLGIYEGSDAYSIQISKGDTFMTFGKQDNPSWWYVKKVDKNTSPMSEESWDYSNSKYVNVDWDKLILTFPKGDKMIYAEMTEKYAEGGGVDRFLNDKTLKNYDKEKIGHIDFYFKKNRKGRYSGMSKEIYFKDGFRPSFAVSFEEEPKMVYENLKEWAKIHNKNFDDIVAVKYAEGGGVEDWMETALNDLKEKSSFDDLEIEYPQENTFSATNGDVEYFVCKDDDVAEDVAIERVMEDMNENPEYFNREFIMNHIDCGDFFENIYREWNMGYATDISTEDDDQYGNRLIAEMVEWGIMSKEDAKGDDAEEIMSERMEDFVEAITEDQLGQDEGFQYYVDNFGEEEAFNIAIDNGLIDITEASEEAVSIDGIGHFLSSYDGKMLYLENGSVAFRNN